MQFKYPIILWKGSYDSKTPWFKLFGELSIAIYILYLARFNVRHLAFANYIV